MEPFTIRPIQPEDNAAIAGIIRSVLTEFGAARPGTVYYDATTDNLYQLFREPKSAYWIVETDGKTAGGGGIYPTAGLPEGYCELVKLYLLPEARGKGLGQRLIRQCFAAAVQLGFRHLYLETMPELHNAIGLYTGLGFRYLEGPLGNSGHFGCDLWMVKDLQEEE